MVRVRGLTSDLGTEMAVICYHEDEIKLKCMAYKFLSYFGNRDSVSISISHVGALNGCRFEISLNLAAGYYQNI